jgi:hypothetical protein
MQKDGIGLMYYSLLAVYCIYLGLTGGASTQSFLLAPLAGILVIGAGSALLSPQLTVSYYGFGRDDHNPGTAACVVLAILIFLTAFYSLTKVVEVSGFEILSQAFDSVSIVVFIISFFVFVHSIMPKRFTEIVPQLMKMESNLLSISISSLAAWAIFALTLTALISFGGLKSQSLFLALGIAYFAVAFFSFNNWFADKTFTF